MHRTDVRMLRGRWRSIVAGMGQIVRMFRRVVFRRVGQIDVTPCSASSSAATPTIFVVMHVTMKMRWGWWGRLMLLLLLGRLR